MRKSNRRAFLVALLAARVVRGAGDRSPFPSPQEFTLAETAADIEKRLGQPQHTAYGRGYRLWQYVRSYGDHPHDDDRFDLTFYFEMPSGALLSVGREYDTPIALTSLHPASQWKRHAYPNAEKPELLVYSHRLGNRVVLAIGVDETKLSTGQILVLRAEALPRFYGWITP